MHLPNGYAADRLVSGCLVWNYFSLSCTFTHTLERNESNWADTSSSLASHLPESPNVNGLSTVRIANGIGKMPSTLFLRADCFRSATIYATFELLLSLFHTSNEAADYIRRIAFSLSISCLLSLSHTLPVLSLFDLNYSLFVCDFYFIDTNKKEHQNSFCVYVEITFGANCELKTICDKLKARNNLARKFQIVSE